MNRNAAGTVHTQRSANVTTQHTITGLSPATFYTVSVTAVGASGSSATFGGVKIETSAFFIYIFNHGITAVFQYFTLGIYSISI